MKAFRRFVFPRTEKVVATVHSTTKKAAEWTVRGETVRSSIWASCVPPANPHDSRNDSNNSDDLNSNRKKTPTPPPSPRTTADSNNSRTNADTNPLNIRKSIFICRHVRSKETPAKRHHLISQHKIPGTASLLFARPCAVAYLAPWYALTPL